MQEINMQVFIVYFKGGKYWHRDEVHSPHLYLKRGNAVRRKKQMEAFAKAVNAELKLKEVPLA